MLEPWTCKISVGEETLTRPVGVRASSMDAILVRGQPYQTVVYRSLAPVVSTVHAILTINGAAAVGGATVTGTRFVLGLNNGATWTVRGLHFGA